jgi:chemotaxis protein histidine kinase CheA
MKFDAQLLRDVRNRFIAEMSEQILALSQHLAQLEDSVAHSDPEVARAGGEEAIKAIMRELHTLKGASSMMDLNEIGELCHGLETVISRYRAASD